MSINIKINGITIHRSPMNDMVFLFTDLGDPRLSENKLAFPVVCPAGSGEEWVKENLGDSYDVAGSNIIMPIGSEEIEAPFSK